MNEKIFQVLFLSRRNSARSIMAEAILNDIGQGRFAAYSASVDPASEFDPHVTELLAANEMQIPVRHPRHYRDFVQEGMGALDFVFTLSDTAAGEAMPEWSGRPVTAHWHCADPILTEGAEWERKRAFARVFSQLQRRLETFVNLPFASLDRMSLQTSVDEIGLDRPGRDS